MLFAGIFATMIPALALLEAKGGSIGVSLPWHYFWSTGALSSFLDNAPTYLVFTSLAQGQVGCHDRGRAHRHAARSADSPRRQLLAACRAER